MISSLYFGLPLPYILYLSIFRPNAENADQNNSKYEHFLVNEKYYFLVSEKY